MSSVNGLPPERERHLAVLLGSLFGEIRDVFAAEDWGGLRQSHFRVISCVPDDGISVTDLAGRVGMTKQGCGQFVTQLEASGHLVTGPSPDDARVRLVRRTEAGHRNAAEVTARIARIEDDWRAVVGEQRYAAFRGVVEELARR